VPDEARLDNFSVFVRHAVMAAVCPAEKVEGGLRNLRAMHAGKTQAARTADF
jgi:hypothetical protein